MNNLLSSDIFFIITSVSVILITAIFVIGLFYIISILRNIKKASELFKNGIKNTSGGLDLLSKFIFYSMNKKKKTKKTKSKIKE